MIKFQISLKANLGKDLAFPNFLLFSNNKNCSMLFKKHLKIFSLLYFQCKPRTEYRDQSFYRFMGEIEPVPRAGINSNPHAPYWA
jgi:hypothetical protein